MNKQTLNKIRIAVLLVVVTAMILSTYYINNDAFRTVVVAISLLAIAANLFVFKYVKDQPIKKSDYFMFIAVVVMAIYTLADQFL